MIVMTLVCMIVYSHPGHTPSPCQCPSPTNLLHNIHRVLPPRPPTPAGGVLPPRTSGARRRQLRLTSRSQLPTPYSKETSHPIYKVSRQRPEMVSWVLRGKLGAHHPLIPVIKLGLRHPRKKERKKERCRSSQQAVHVTKVPARRDFGARTHQVNGGFAE